MRTFVANMHSTLERLRVLIHGAGVRGYVFGLDTRATKPCLLQRWNVAVDSVDMALRTFGYG